jgi:hypothetical protein
MDTKLVYVKTPIGDEAIRQSTRVVQRNLRMVLVQVDGKLSVGELSKKIGNPRLVERALKELVEGGFVAESAEAVSAWVQAKNSVNKAQISALSQFSTFGEKTPAPDDSSGSGLSSVASNFSTFGKPILPTAGRGAKESNKARVEAEVVLGDEAPVAKQSAKWVKRVLAGVFALLVCIVAGAIFYPYASYKPALERAMSGYLQVPVRIGQVEVSLLPVPRLKLLAILIGETADSRIDEVRIASPLSLLLGDGKEISMVDISGASISSNRILALPMFQVGGGKSSGAIIVREIRLEKSQVVAGDLALRDVSGRIRFKPSGGIENAAFETVDRSIQLTTTPTDQGLALKIEGLGWKLPGSGLSFESLQADGLLQKDKLLIQNLDTTFLGGLLKGSWLLDWSKGLVIAGDGSLSRLDCKRIAAAFAPNMKLEGDLAGVLHLRAAGNDWASMWRNVEATLDAEVTRGLFHGVDLGEVARRSATSAVRAGSTKFERLKGRLVISSNQFVANDVQLEAGMMSSLGQFAVNQGRIDGNMTVSLQTSVSSVRVPVRLSGVLPDISAVGTK